MFQKNDLLVAQDRLFKERNPYRITQAKYGRVFKCPITYLRVTDRLGNSRAFKTTIIRGGLRKRLVVLRISAYDRPIAVNIYVGCENKLKFTTKKKTTEKPKEDEKQTEANKETSQNIQTNVSNMTTNIDTNATDQIVTTETGNATDNNDTDNATNVTG
ncbi:hypothetical protein O0L34_g13778 [Tuta absoluta]|nr:hypothetical protein O0L34_g13778 [Tuta absoluta]